jgi:hypothetical protein
VSACYGKKGIGYLKQKIGGFNNAAKGMPFFILADLDMAECPPLLVKEWLPAPSHNNLLFRIAVREVEAWLLADRKGFSKFLGLNLNRIPVYPDELRDPKNTLIQLSKRCRKRAIRSAIVPEPSSTARIGPEYNAILSEFVNFRWNPEDARKSSPSLDRTINKISDFRPVWPQENHADQ